MRIFLAPIAAALTLGACANYQLQPADANGVIPLTGSGNYVFNKTTGSYSRFSSDAHLCQEPALSVLAPGCSIGDGGEGGAGAAAASGK